MFKKLSLLVISLSTCVSLASTKLIHDSDLLNAKIYQLENGLKVYLTKNTQSPTFYAEIAVRCGSIHDPANATGMAHYLEHLMFKGSQKLGTSDFEKEEPLLNQITELYDEHSKTTDPEKRKEIYAKINDLSQQSAKLAIANEMDRLYQSLGGSDVNAHTSLEETVYKVNLPSNSGDSRNWNQLLSQIYPNHPYGETVLGKPEHLKNPSISALYKHYNTYYVPNNMAILISGDIDFEKTLGLIEKHFGSWEAGKGEIPQPAKPINKLNGVKRSEIFFEGEEYITMAFPTVPFDHPDIEALYMFDMLMDNSVVGLINLNLVQAQKVRSAGSYPYALHHAGTQHFYAYPREGQSLEELEKLILEQVNLVKEGKFDEGILDAIITDLRLDEETSYEDNASRVAAMRDSFLSGKSWNYDLQYFPRLEKVTKDDIIRAAKKYFTDSYVVVHKKNGKADIESIEKPKIDPIEMNASAQSDFAKQILEIKNEPLQPQFLKENEHYLKSSKNGIDFVTVENPVNNVFSLTWHFKTGKLTDNRLDLALSSLDLSGTESATASELMKLSPFSMTT